MKRTKYQFKDRAEAESEYARVCNDNTLLSIAINHVHHDKPDVSVRVDEPADKHTPRAKRNHYCADLYSAESPSGGIIVVTYYCPQTGQTPYTIAKWFENLKSATCLMRLENPWKQIVSALNVALYRRNHPEPVAEAV